MASKYWQTCVEEAVSEIGIVATSEQVAQLAEAMSHISEMESEATGRYFIPNPLETRLKETEAKLKRERELIHCRKCDGTGRLQYNSGPWGVDTGCDKCHGAGKHMP